MSLMSIFCQITDRLQATGISFLHAPYRPNCNAVDRYMENRIPHTPAVGLSRKLTLLRSWRSDFYPYVCLPSSFCYFSICILFSLFLYKKKQSPHHCSPTFYHGFMVDQTLICTNQAFTQVSDFSECFVISLKICWNIFSISSNVHISTVLLLWKLNRIW